MEVKVHLNNVRITARKSRQVADLVRGKTLAQARTLLDFTVRRPADPILKLLNSAAASATHDFKLDESNLYISRLTVDEGPTLKRSFPMSRGRAYPIMKRTSHITLILSEKNPSEKKPENTENKPNVKSEKPKKISKPRNQKKK